MKRVHFLMLLAIILIVGMIVTDPVPVYNLIAKTRGRALWDKKLSTFLPSWKWRCFNDFARLSKSDEFFKALAIFQNSYQKKPVEYRLVRPEAVSAMLAMSAEVLRPLPQSSVLITKTEEETYPLWFVQKVSKIRPDVLILCTDLWENNSYRKNVWKNSFLKESFEFARIKSAEFGNVATLSRELASTQHAIFMTSLQSSNSGLPQESLYFVPVGAYLYSPFAIPDTFHAIFIYKMLRSQNWNYVSENPPNNDENEYTLSGANKLTPNVVKTVSYLHNVGKDSLAKVLLLRSDVWMMWDPTYLENRIQLAGLLSDNQKDWIIASKGWLERNPGKLGFQSLSDFIANAESTLSLDEPVKVPVKSKTEGKKSGSGKKNRRRR
jgi:hypothetical protein